MVSAHFRLSMRDEHSRPFRVPTAQRRPISLSETCYGRLQYAILREREKRESNDDNKTLK